MMPHAPENPYAAAPLKDAPPPRAPRWRLWGLTALAAAACPALVGGVALLFLDPAWAQFAGSALQLICGFGGAAAALFVLWKGNIAQRILVLAPACFLVWRGIPNALHVLLFIIGKLW